MISILITNYNKGSFLFKNLKLLKKSKFKNFEIIIYDDNSSDDSIKIIKKFKKIKLIRNSKKKYKSPALNQIHGISKAFNISKGKIICLLDADDYFNINKLKVVNNYFIKNAKSKSVFNLAVTSKNKFDFKLKKNKKIWPSIFPTSCISLTRKNYQNFIKNLKPTMYPHLEVDARFAIYSKFFNNEYNVIRQKLTTYNEDHFGITSKITKFSKKWWFRRYEAFKYMDYILKKKSKKIEISLDYLITYLVYKFFNFKI